MTEQQLLPTIEPSENDLVEIAMKTPLDKKIERNINILKHWEKDAISKDKDGFSVGDSGGKDSDCIVELCKMAGVKFKSPEALYKWWITGEKNSEDPNCIFEEMMEGLK